MPHIIKIEKFEGPLDLLLQFIMAEELDISEVSLAQVTDQYVEYIEQAELLPEEIADFLNIAARLLLIKSKLLLPAMLEAEPDSEMDLAQQLKMYSQFVAASKTIDQLWKQPNNMYAREKFFYKQEGFYPPRQITAKSLSASFQEIIKKIKPFIRLPERTIRQVISLREKIHQLAAILRERTNFSFQETLTPSGGATEMIVSFLALLELVKQRQALVEQPTTFAEITIRKFENNYE